MLAKAIRYFQYDPYTVLAKLGLTTDTQGDGNRWILARTQRKIAKYGVAELFARLQSPPTTERYKLFVSGHKQHDSINLYEMIVKSRARTVLEFGSGVSTIMMAHAIKRGGKGKVYSIETDAKWADVVRGHLADNGLDQHAEIIVSEAVAEEFNGQTVASFQSLPDIRPDLIYVDGPDPAHVTGHVRGLTMKNMFFIVLKDPLLYEWSMYVGAKIVLDGRLHNYRFLQANLKRTWRARRKLLQNINEFHLVR